MLQLKLQYFGHLMRRADSLEKTLMLGKIEGRRRRGWQRMRWLDDITDLMDMSLRKLQEWVMGREAWHDAVHGITKSRTRLSDWTELPLQSHQLPWVKTLHHPSSPREPSLLQVLEGRTPLYLGHPSFRGRATHPEENKEVQLFNKCKGYTRSSWLDSDFKRMWMNKTKGQEWVVSEMFINEMNMCKTFSTVPRTQ